MGFDAVDRILSSVGGRWSAPDELAGHRASIAEAEIEGRRVTFMKPLTYMNLSGEPVSEWARTHSIERTDVLVYLDDVALPLGRLRLRERGTDGGHNGLKSVLESLGGTDVPRVRIGIRPNVLEGSEGPESKDEPDGRLEELADFVLAPFTAEERPLVDDVLSRVVSATRMILLDGTRGMAKAMSRYNAAPSPAGEAGEAGDDR